MNGEKQLVWWKSRLDEPCFVYVIQGDPGTPIKVGVAKDVAARVAGLQTGNPQRLRILHVLPGGHDLEAHFHQRLKRDRIHGEWFKGHLVPGFLEYVEKLGGLMQDAYEPTTGVAPVWTEVDKFKYGKVRAPKREPGEVTVRFVEPDPKIDPEEAAKLRETAPGLIQAHPLARRQISNNHQS